MASSDNGSPFLTTCAVSSSASESQSPPGSREQPHIMVRFTRTVMSSLPLKLR